MAQAHAGAVACSTGLEMILPRNFAFGASTPWVDDRRFERRRDALHAGQANT